MYIYKTHQSSCALIFCEFFSCGSDRELFRQFQRRLNWSLIHFKLLLLFTCCSVADDFFCVIGLSNIKMIWIVIGKMFTNQSITENKNCDKCKNSTNMLLDISADTLNM